MVATSLRRSESRVRLIFCFFATLNLTTLAWLFLNERFTDATVIGAVAAFWCIAIAWPAVVDLDYLFQPRNYVFFLFGLTIAVSPPFLYTHETSLTRWILDWSPQFWSYVGTTLWVWVLSFACYCIGLRKPGTVIKPPARMPNRDDRLGLLALLLISVGIAGLWMAAGSIQDLVAIRGQRTLSVELINVEGRGRYLAWFSLAPVGVCLLWMYVHSRFQLGARTGLIAAFAIYLPLIAFFSYTSGRGATVLPFLLLMNLYYLYANRFSPIWALGGFLVCLPVFGFWSIYRQDGWVFTGEESIVQLSIEVLMNAFSRLDVSVASIAGVSTGDIPLLKGETLLAALIHPIPSWMVGRPFTGGTMAMATAVFVDAKWDEASGMATPLMIEGLLNFGLIGVAVFSLGLGYLTRKLELVHSSQDPLVLTFAASATLALPFGASLEVIHASFIWTVLFPFVVAWIVRRVLFGAVGVARPRA